MIDDVVGIAASNHGSLVADGYCVVGCPAAIWQQTTGSAFLAALNDGAETSRTGTGLLDVGVKVATSLAGAPLLTAEPALRCYATDTC